MVKLLCSLLASLTLPVSFFLLSYHVFPSLPPSLLLSHLYLLSMPCHPLTFPYFLYLLFFLLSFLPLLTLNYACLLPFFTCSIHFISLLPLIHASLLLSLPSSLFILSLPLNYIPYLTLPVPSPFPPSLPINHASPTIPCLSLPIPSLPSFPLY